MIVDECLLQTAILALQCGHRTRTGEPFHLAYCADHFPANAHDLSGKQIKILLHAAMICNRDAQTILIVQGSVGWRGNSLFVELHQNLLVQRIELLHHPVRPG